MNKEMFAFFEIQHGFKRRENLSSQQKPLLRSRAQWKERGRAVLDGSQAVKVVLTKSGHHLRLYSEAQTRSLSDL
jgi:hypothetical protein